MHKTMQARLVTIALAALMPLGALADAAAQAKGAAAPAVANDMTDAEVRKIDAAGGRVTLKHGAIRNLDMPPMTMVFVVKDKSVLDRLKVGDKVRFKASDEGGQLTVTALRAAP